MLQQLDASAMLATQSNSFNGQVADEFDEFDADELKTHFDSDGHVDYHSHPKLEKLEQIVLEHFKSSKRSEAKLLTSLFQCCEINLTSARCGQE